MHSLQACMCTLFSLDILQAGVVKGLTLFPASYEHMKRFLSKCTALKVRVVIGPSNMTFSGVFVYAFQPEYFTGWSSEGVKARRGASLVAAPCGTCDAKGA